MARRQSVDDLYGGRSFPHGQVRDGSHHRIEIEPAMETGNTRGTAFNKNTVQDPEDKHDDKAGYDNDTSGWIKGAGEVATRMPHFDHSPPRNKMRR